MTKKNNDSSTTQDNNEHSKFTNYTKEHFQTSIEYGQNLFSTIHAAGHEVSKKITDTCAANLALGKSFLNCNKFEDVVDWTEKMVKTNLDHCLSSLHSVYNQTCTEVNKAHCEMAKKIGKNFAKIKNKFED